MTDLTERTEPNPDPYPHPNPHGRRNGVAVAVDEDRGVLATDRVFLYLYDDMNSHELLDTMSRSCIVMSAHDHVTVM